VHGVIVDPKVQPGRISRTPEIADVVRLDLLLNGQGIEESGHDDAPLRRRIEHLLTDAFPEPPGLPRSVNGCFQALFRFRVCVAHLPQNSPNRIIIGPGWFDSIFTGRGETRQFTTVRELACTAIAVSKSSCFCPESRLTTGEFRTAEI